MNSSNKQHKIVIKPTPGLKPKSRKKTISLNIKQPLPPNSSRTPKSTSLLSKQASSTLTFSEPLSGNYILENYYEFLTFLEEKEIINYSEVYYLRRTVPNSKASNAITPQLFQFIPKEHIHYRFEMLDLLGKGSFGGVIKCLDHKTNQNVAIKFLRDRPNHHDQIVSEHSFLQKLQVDNGPEMHHIIKFHESFLFRGYFCLVEELLDLDLYRVLQRNHFKGLRISTVQLIARGLAASLKFSHEHKIVHCDVKPENILFTSRRHISIKLIDFGCSCPSGEMPFSYIQSRFYRAPEIVLGLPYGPPIDIWSFACVIYELLTGKVLFEGEDEFELIQLQMGLLGVPPNEIIAEGNRSQYYFNSEFKPILRPNEAGNFVLPGTLSLSKLLSLNDKLLISLLSDCLKWNANERLTPEQIMNHPWLNPPTSADLEKVIPPSTARKANPRSINRT